MTGKAGSAQTDGLTAVLPAGQKTQRALGQGWGVGGQGERGRIVTLPASGQEITGSQTTTGCGEPNPLTVIPCPGGRRGSQADAPTSHCPHRLPAGPRRGRRVLAEPQQPLPPQERIIMAVDLFIQYLLLSFFLITGVVHVHCRKIGGYRPAKSSH